MKSVCPTFAVLVMMAVLGGLSQSCFVNDDIYVPQEVQPEPSDETSGNYKPVMGAYTEMKVSVPEMSGLCLSQDKSFLWAVGDEGIVSKVSFEGVATTVWTTDADMEDVTLDPETGDLYVAIEGDQQVRKVKAPSFNSSSVLFSVQEAIDGNFGNSGLEGVSYYKDRQLFVGAQTGATLWLYKLDGTVVWKKLLTQLTSDIAEVGGLCYDAESDHLWVSDSKRKKLFVFDAECKQLEATYSVSFIDNAESVCVDHANGCVWVGSDENSPKLYRIEFTDL